MGCCFERDFREITKISYIPLIWIVEKNEPLIIVKNENLDFFHYFLAPKLTKHEREISKIYCILLIVILEKNKPLIIVKNENLDFFHYFLGRAKNFLAPKLTKHAREITKIYCILLIVILEKNKPLIIVKNENLDFFTIFWPQNWPNTRAKSLKSIAFC